MYQGLDALALVAKATGANSRDIQNIFFNKAHHLIESEKSEKAKLQMVWPNAPPLQPLVSKGWTLRTYRLGDEEEYIRELFTFQASFIHLAASSAVC